MDLSEDCAEVLPQQHVAEQLVAYSGRAPVRTPHQNHAFCTKPANSSNREAIHQLYTNWEQYNKTAGQEMPELMPGIIKILINAGYPDKKLVPDNRRRPGGAEGVP